MDILQFKGKITKLAFFLFEAEQHIPTYHHAGQFLGIGLTGFFNGDQFAFIQYAHPVRIGDHFIHLMSDKNCGLALTGHLLNDTVEFG